MIPRRLFLPLIVITASCAGRCSCAEPSVESVEPARSVASQSIRWAISAADRTPVELAGGPGRLSSSGASGSVLWIGDGPRGQWLHHLELALDVNRFAVGPVSLALNTSRCRIRYLQDGRETEADYSVARATVESLTFDGERWTARIDLECAKIVPTRADGEPYAAPLPDTVRVQGTAWAKKNW